MKYSKCMMEANNIPDDWNLASVRSIDRKVMSELYDYRSGEVVRLAR